MKKIILFKLVFVFLIIQSSTAQVRQIVDAMKPKKAFEGTPILQKKSQVLSFGFGTPNKLYDFLDFNGIGNSLGNAENDGAFGPLMLDYEYFIKDNIGIGASLLYATAKKNYRLFGADYTGDIKQFQIGLSTYYHFYTTDKLDPYIKGTVGINLWDGKYKDNNNQETGNFVVPTPFGFRSLIGLRYFVSENIALNGEGSVTLSPNFTVAANIGVTYKLK